MPAVKSLDSIQYSGEDDDDMNVEYGSQSSSTVSKQSGTLNRQERRFRSKFIESDEKK